MIKRHEEEFDKIRLELQNVIQKLIKHLDLNEGTIAIGQGSEHKSQFFIINVFPEECYEEDYDSDECEAENIRYELTTQDKEFLNSLRITF